MDFQFIIPCRNADLLDSGGDNYYVKHVYDAVEIPDQLKSCKQALSDPFVHIFDHFDVYFSVIENAASITPINLSRSFDLLYVTTDKLGNDLMSFLSGQDTQSGKDRAAYLNLTKMTIYLYVNITKSIEQIVQQSQQGQLKKSKKTTGGSIETLPDWDQKRFKFLVQMFNIVQIPLEKLWSPPIAEETFVNLICDICYRLLEANTPKEKHVGDTIFQILGTAIKRYNHAMTFPVKILQILRTSESAAITIAKGIHLLAEEFGITSIFRVVMKDIVETLTVDSGDSAISKNFSNFLIELSTVSPKLMIPHLSTFSDDLLNCESHVLRNSILQIMGDAVVTELTSEELPEESKTIRNEFLEDILSHICDVSAHVRARALHILNHIKEQEAVPLSFQHKVLLAAVDRLDDRTSTVRKNAIILIKTFLERNPFSHKLSLEELRKKYEEECEKMEQLKLVIDEERKKAEKIDEEWELVIPELLPFIEESLKQSQDDDHVTDENFEDIIQRVATMLVEKKYKESVALVKRAEYSAGNAELRESLNMQEQCAYYLALLKSYLCLSRGCKDSNEEFGTQIKTVSFLEDSINFSKVIAVAVPKIQNMLQSKTNADVFEAVDFFTTGYVFGIKGTEEGMRRMLYLVWSSDKEKADAVSNGYKKVLFTTDLSGRAHAAKVIENLSKILKELSIGHYAAFEVLIKDWVKSEDIDLTMIQLLFEKFTMKLDGTTEEDARLALQLLIMASSAKSSIASANLSVAETVGFGERGMKDSRIFTGCLEFFLNSNDQTINSKYHMRYDVDNPLIQKVINQFQKFFFHPRAPEFDKIATKSIEFIYHLCQAPDVICQKMIHSLHKKLKQLVSKITEMKANADLPPTQQTQDAEVPSSQVSDEPRQPKIRLPTFLLARFIFMVGFMTMKEMIFLDIDVYNNMKLIEELKEEKKNANKKKGLLFNKRKTLNLDMSASGSLKRLSCSAAEPQQEPDEDLVGATAEDSIAELINHICEDVLLFDEKGILFKFIPIIIEICKSPSKYNDQHLQQAATLALIRCMAVSSRFCESQMPFVMNILNLTKNVRIKCNIIIGLSDLTFRFPNVIEPWTGHFYSTLHETNDEIRLTAVKMLSHLILHEMIRVKGQIADLAMCIVDDNEEIKDITHQFFKEIANKSNILYNVLPDIISKLSDVNLNLDEDKYRIIMRYILGLIQKDRQVETLVDKLCLRFRATTTERQWRDIAYCLSLLNYNEKTIKKLTDNIQHFKDKVQVDEVYQSFKLIISNTSKLAKPELKAVITEFESRLAECLEVGDNNDIGSGTEFGGSQMPRSSQATCKKSTKANTKKKAPARRGKKAASSSEGESQSSASDSDDAQTQSSRRSSRRGQTKTQATASKAKSKPTTKIIEESESSDEEEMPQRKRGKKR